MQIRIYNKYGLKVAFIAYNKKKTIGKMDPDIEKRIKEAEQEQEQEAKAKKEAAQNNVFFFWNFYCMMRYYYDLLNGIN